MQSASSPKNNGKRDRITGKKGYKERVKGPGGYGSRTKWKEKLAHRKNGKLIREKG